MARMYSRKGGRSGSSKPANPKADWVKYKPQEIKEIVLKLAGEGKTAAEIGIELRDRYGIPSVRMLTKEKIGRIMKDGGVETSLPQEMLNLLRRAVKLRAHLDENSHDGYCKRGLELTESKIRRLAKYYQGRKMLPKEWKYDPEKAKLLVK